MAAVREVSRFSREPRRVRRVRRAHEGERPPEGVDDLLIVPVIVGGAFAPPLPSGRQLPPLEVRGEAVRSLSFVGDERMHAESVDGFALLN